MRLVGSARAHRNGLAVLLYYLMYRISFRRRSVNEVNTPRAMTSRSIFETRAPPGSTTTSTSACSGATGARRSASKGGIRRIASEEVTRGQSDRRSVGLARQRQRRAKRWGGRRG